MISNIIKNRRSISKFSSKKIDIKVIDEIIDISSYAPSSCNTQPWFFLIFNSEDAKNKLNSYIQKWYDYTKNDILKNNKFFWWIYIKILNFFEKYWKFDNAPVYILVFSRPYDTPIFSQAIELSKNKQIERISDESVKTSCAMAMQNFLLLAHEKWLWTRIKDWIKFLINFSDLKHDFYKEFEIPTNYELLSGIQLWYPMESELNKLPSKRLTLNKIRKYI